MNTKRALVQLAQRYIKENIYLTLATQGKTPWAAPLYYCRGPKNALYVASQPSSRHIRNLRYNPHVAFAIFDSHAPEGQGNGVQGSGTLSVCQGERLKEALRYYHTSFFPCSEDTFKKGPYRIYKIQPRHLYILDPEETQVDTRIEVQL